jgi:CRP-like cAMP-binding protein
MGASVSVSKLCNFDKTSISNDRKIRYLEHTPFFQYLNEESIKEFAQCFPTTLRSRPGTNISLDSQRIYIVAEGEVDLSTSYPEEGTKVEARGYLCRKRQGDIVNVHQTKQDVKRRMTVKSNKVRDFAEEITISGCGDSDVLLLSSDMDALDTFIKSHPDLSKPFETISTTQIEDLLQTMIFLKGVPKSKLNVLAAMCRYEAFDSGQVVFEENSQAKKLYLVLSGLAQVVAKDLPSVPSLRGVRPNTASSTSSRSLPTSTFLEQSVALQRSLECSCDCTSLVESDEVAIAELTNGQYFGETALVFNIDRTCSVKTAEKSLFLTVHKTDFENFLKICPIEESLKAVIKQRMVSKLSSLGIPFLNGIPEDMISSLTSSVAINEVPSNHAVFCQGDVGDNFYIIVHGSVKVASKIEADTTIGDRIANEEGDGIKVARDMPTENNIGTLGPGQYFGEMALVNSDNALRTATVTSTQKSILLSIDKESFQTVFGSNRQVLAEFELRVMKGSAQLSHILAHSLGIASFRNFLEKEHAGENIDFWVAVNDFGNAMFDDAGGVVMIHSDSLEKAKRIFVTFCAEYADRQVNLPHKMVAELDAKINGDGGITPDLFNASQQEIYKLMEKDKFARYKNSDDFKVSCLSLMS